MLRLPPRPRNGPPTPRPARETAAPSAAATVPQASAAPLPDGCGRDPYEARERGTRVGRPATTPVGVLRAGRRASSVSVRPAPSGRAHGTAVPAPETPAEREPSARLVGRWHETATGAGGDGIPSHARTIGRPVADPPPEDQPRLPDPSHADAAGTDTAVTDTADDGGAGTAPAPRDDVVRAAGARFPGDAASPGGGDPAPTEPEGHSPVSDMSTTPSGLPVRVPQANLAEPLRTGEPVVAAEEPEEPEDPGRTPEEIQRIMGAYQRGTRKGRSDAAEKADRGGTPSGTDTAEGEEDQ